jgi:hypothetical protein
MPAPKPLFSVKTNLQSEVKIPCEVYLLPYFIDTAMKLIRLLVIVSLIVLTVNVGFAQRPTRPGSVPIPPPPNNTSTNAISPL